MRNNEMLSERRRFTRIPFEAAVYLTNPSGEWYGKLVDISLKGALISRPQHWHQSPGDQAVMQVNAPDHGFEIQMNVTVIHASDQIIGFRCDKIDIDSITHLRRLVELNTGDVALLNRELALLGR